LEHTTKILRFSPLTLAAITTTLLALSCISVADLSSDDQKNADSKGLFLESIEWGRLVDVYDIAGDLVESDVLIDHLVTTSSIVELSANAVTQEESLIIQYPQESAEFVAVLFDLKDNLQTIERRDVIGESTYDLLARNASLRLNFNLPINPDTVNSSSVQIFQGVSDNDLQQFVTRYVTKNFSSTNSSLEGGIIVDPTISLLEAAEEQLPSNVLGYGPSANSSGLNMAVYIPTEIDYVNGVYTVLSTLDGAFGPQRRDPDEPVKLLGLDNYMLLAAMRTGNEFDEYSGFMRDAIRPSLLGIQDTTIASHSFNGSNIDVIYSVDAANCQDLMPKIGDVFEVVDNGISGSLDPEDDRPPKNNIWTVVSVIDSVGPVLGVRCVNEDYVDGTQYTAVVPGKLSTRYNASDSNIQACYLDIVPDPTNSLPVGGILDTATVTLHFDESINPSTVRSTSTFVIIQPDDLANPDPQDIKESQTAWYRQIDNTETVGDYIERQRGYDYRPLGSGLASPDTEFGGRILFGQVVPSNSNKSYSITPAAGWQDLDIADAFDQYVIAIRDGDNGIRDMAGNQIRLSSFVAGNEGQSIQLSVTHQTPEDAKYFTLLGGALDEDSDGNADWAGQINTDVYGAVSGRSPSRFTAAADNKQLSLSTHLVGNAPSEPLNFAGAVVMNVYRPEDFGFGYENSVEFNYTIDGFGWAPLNGTVYDENYDQISLALSHSFSMPDEMYGVNPNIPIWPQSGMLTTSFHENVLGYEVDGSNGLNEEQMFDSAYYVRDINKYKLDGVDYLSWPDFTGDFVWRDTSFDQAYYGGRSGSAGAPTDNYINIMAQWDAGAGKRYAPGAIPTVALPLQCRFRTYPQIDALSLNAFTTSLMMSPTNSPPKLPMFRIYSAGGQDATGVWNRVQPDQAGESGGIPVGGYLSGGMPTTEVGDDLLYWASADFAVEVSRAHTHWFDLSAPLNSGSIKGVILEPSAEDQPVGTSIVVEYRGSQSVSTSGADPSINSTPLNDANVYLGDLPFGDRPFDHYGDFIGGTGSVSTPSAWTTDITDLEDHGYSFIQVRVSFIANPDLGLRPSIDGLGFVWTN
jgi:hypothetical protein